MYESDEGHRYTEELFNDGRCHGVLVQGVEGGQFLIHTLVNCQCVRGSRVM